jgi:hypothetical protein
MVDIPAMAKLAPMKPIIDPPMPASMPPPPPPDGGLGGAGEGPGMGPGACWAGVDGAKRVPGVAYPRTLARWRARSVGSGKTRSNALSHARKSLGSLPPVARLTARNACAVDPRPIRDKS